MSEMTIDERFTADGRETLAGAGKMWSTEFRTQSGDVVRVRRVSTHDWKNVRDREPGIHYMREVFVDFRVSVNGRLVNSFLTKPLALAFAKRLAAKTDAVFA